MASEQRKNISREESFVVKIGQKTNLEKKENCQL